MRPVGRCKTPPASSKTNLEFLPLHKNRKAMGAPTMQVLALLLILLLPSTLAAPVDESYINVVPSPDCPNPYMLPHRKGIHVLPGPHSDCMEGEVCDVQVNVGNDGGQESKVKVLLQYNDWGLTYGPGWKNISVSPIFKIPANGGFANTMFHHTFNDAGHICMKASVLPQPTNSHKYNTDKTDDTTQINLRVVLDDIIDPDLPFRFDIPIRNNRTKPILFLDEAKIKFTCPPIPDGLGPEGLEGLAMLAKGSVETLPFPPKVNKLRDFDGYFDKVAALLQNPGDVGDVGEECEDEFKDPQNQNIVYCGCKKWKPFIRLNDIKLHRPHYVPPGGVAPLSLEARFVKNAYLSKCTAAKSKKCTEFKNVFGLSMKRFGFRIDVEVEKEKSNVELIVERATFADAVQTTVDSFFDVFFDVFVPSDTAVKDHRLCRLQKLLAYLSRSASLLKLSRPPREFLQPLLEFVEDAQEGLLFKVPPPPEGLVMDKDGFPESDFIDEEDDLEDLIGGPSDEDLEYKEQIVDNSNEEEARAAMFDAELVQMELAGSSSQLQLPYNTKTSPMLSIFKPPITPIGPYHPWHPHHHWGQWWCPHHHHGHHHHHHHFHCNCCGWHYHHWHHHWPYFDHPWWHWHHHHCFYFKHCCCWWWLFPHHRHFLIKAQRQIADLVRSVVNKLIIKAELEANAAGDNLLLNQAREMFQEADQLRYVDIIAAVKKYIEALPPDVPCDVVDPPVAIFSKESVEMPAFIQPYDLNTAEADQDAASGVDNVVDSPVAKAPSGIIGKKGIPVPVPDFINILQPANP